MNCNDDNTRANARAVPIRTRTWPMPGKRPLRLVHSGRPTMDLSTGIRAAPSLICINTRRGLRHKEGIIMKTIEKLYEWVSRFAVGLGSGLALVCAYVIVTGDPGLGTSPAAQPEVVRLEPVVVTISAERFAAIQAEERGEPLLAHKQVGKVRQG